MIFYGVLTILAVASGVVVVPSIVLMMLIERLERMAPAPELCDERAGAIRGRGDAVGVMP